ncbi:MAG TPA: hypothetical protein VMS22_19585 [Candidatus Eisenbacteria bacterium]|nr:hypothetical protein [Candidatus Eisenbacteria bacterium]
MERTPYLLAALALAVPLAVPRVHAQQAKCLANKTKCVAKLAGGLVKCQQLATTPAKPADVDAGGCIDKLEDKFDGGVEPAKGCFEKLEGKVPNDCVTIDDTQLARDLIAACVDSLVTAIDPAPIDQSKCGAGKLKCAAKKLLGLLKCQQVAATPGKSIDPNAGGCIDKVVLKFDGGQEPAKGCFAKLEAKEPNDCLPPMGNAADAETQVDACVANLVAALTTPTTTSTSTSSSSSTSTSTSSTTTSSTSTSSTTTTSTSSTTTTSTSTSLPSTTSSSTTTSTSTTTTTLPFGTTCDGDGVVARLGVSTGNLGGAVAQLSYGPVVTFPGSGFDTDPNGDHLIDLTGRGGVLLGVDSDTNGDTIDDRLRITYVLTGGTSFGPGAWVDVRFDCTPGVPVSSADLACSIVSASDAGGNPVSGVACMLLSLQ